MKLTIEKRPTLTMLNHYFVLSHGEKSVEIETNALKSILLIWVFCSVCIFSFIVGQSVAQTNVAITAYMMQGNVTDLNGNPVTCNAVLNEKNVIEWKCITMNETNEAKIVLSR
jgi:hypothetical protein